MGYVYFGENAGARILRYGVGYSQTGDPYQLEVRYWDAYPFGQDGEGVIRELVGFIRHTAGYNVDLVPIVDGVELSASRFSGGAPPGGLTEAIAECRAAVFERCTRIGAIVRSVQLFGETELVDVGYQPVPLRESP
jgi:hypothetical protein